MVTGGKRSCLGLIVIFALNSTLENIVMLLFVIGIIKIQT
jgi:hypothetical protein